MRSRLLATSLLAALLLASACATAGGGGGAGEPIRIRVKNNLIPPSPLSIFILPETGSRQFIGTVPPSATRTLTVQVGIVTGQYRLVAETSGGEPIVSHPFTLVEPATVVWDLNSRTISVRTTVEEEP